MTSAQMDKVVKAHTPPEKAWKLENAYKLLGQYGEIPTVLSCKLCAIVIIKPYSE